MKRGSKVGFTCLTIVIIMLFGNISTVYGVNSNYINNNQEVVNYIKKFNSYIYKEQQCFNFVDNKLSSTDNSIFTNYLTNNNEEEYSTGHEILSESEGLIMLYAVYKNDKGLFEEHYEIVNNKLMMGSGLLKWRIKGNDFFENRVSASIDDMRISRALLYAYTKWNDYKYLTTFERINNGLLNKNVYNGIITDLYDEYYDYASKSVPLSYLDLTTMSEMNSFGDKRWQEIYNNSLRIIEGGYINDDIPLYRMSYDVEIGKYDDYQYVDVLQSLIVIYNLASAGEVKEESIDWIKEKLNEGRVYSRYNIEGEAISDIQSTAIYALIGRIAKELNDLDMYCNAVDLMLQFQIVNEESEIYGSFGDEATLQVYSFDNLQALLALQ